METIACDTCGTETGEFARGWRAYLVLPLVLVACPECAELYGEDESRPEAAFGWS